MTGTDDRIAEELMRKKMNEWTAEDLNDCGRILAAGGHPELKTRLAIDPDPVEKLLGISGPAKLPPGSRKARKKLSEAHRPIDTWRIRGDVNRALCHAAAAAFARNEAYYMPRQKRDRDTVTDFCSLVWEYLQTEAFERPRRSESFSMSAFLAEAAQPNGWIGTRRVFVDPDREHSYRVKQGIRPPYLYVAEVSVDNGPDGDDLGILEKYAQPVFGTVRDPYRAVIDRTDLEALISRVSGLFPRMDMRVYLWFCLQEGYPVRQPGSGLIEYFRAHAPQRLRAMPDKEIRAWFGRHYRALIRTCRAEDAPKKIAAMKPQP
ncbi:MAG: hypothetical protein IJR62_04885 [Lachnospiraceae bacterium]|nr:hypothetical protein [Lachnospiraceae bacterium]